MTAEAIFRIAEAEAIPVLGIAPASAKADERPRRWPQDLLPGARCLIQRSTGPSDPKLSMFARESQ